MTFQLRVFKCTFTFEMPLIPSWTNQFKPHPHTCRLGRPTSTPHNYVACLLTFAWRWTRIAMTLSAEVWCLGCSKLSVMSDLIQNIKKTSQVRWKLKTDTWLIIYNVNWVINSFFGLFMESCILRVSWKVNVKPFLNVHAQIYGTFCIYKK